MSDYETILALARSWPAAQRFSSVRDVPVPLAPIECTPLPTLRRARGLPATNDALPTDWLEERRAEWYGV